MDRNSVGISKSFSVYFCIFPKTTLYNNGGWWIKMMNGQNTKLRPFVEALNLVTSVQLSSAASEKVLSN
jgi:hypothetical protein